MKSFLVKSCLAALSAIFASALATQAQQTESASVTEGDRQPVDDASTAAAAAAPAYVFAFGGA